TGKTVPYEPYTLLNARLGWNSSNMRIYLEGDNLLNRPYYDHGNIPQPGAWFKFGISRSFNF
ncbi:MAG: TonB-dependent receptor, partial [Bacteroidales bacterium]|nr:TonB-dependent receptor [Bacteroidales bacterium]